VTTFLLAGRLYEAKARRNAGQAMRDLAAASARDVCVLADDGTEQRIPAARLRAGQRFVVRRGSGSPPTARSCPANPRWTAP
jgi:Cu+-exporting ATPase